jgi:hypothetical protein
MTELLNQIHEVEIQKLKNLLEDSLEEIWCKQDAHMNHGEENPNTVAYCQEVLKNLRELPYAAKTHFVKINVEFLTLLQKAENYDNENLELEENHDDIWLMNMSR